MKTQHAFLDFEDGQVVTLERTPFVDKLIEGGRVVIVDDNPPEAVGTIIDGVIGDTPVELDERTDSEREADEQAAAARAELGVPKRSASRDDWAEFLAENTPIVTDGKSRSELQAEWDQLDTAPSTEG